MRRVWAILWLALFSVSLIVSASSAFSKPELPDCCRASGKHHCSLKRASAQDVAGASIGNSGARCPNFPNLRSVPAHPYSSLSGVGQTGLNALVRGAAAHAQTEALYRMTLSRACQERGPPPILS